MHLTLVFGVCLEKSCIFVSSYKIKTLLCFKDVCFQSKISCILIPSSVNFVASVLFIIQVSTCIHWHTLVRRATSVRCVVWHFCQAHILSAIHVSTQENAHISARHVVKDSLNVITWLHTTVSTIHWEPMPEKAALRKFTGTLFTCKLVTISLYV